MNKTLTIALALVAGLMGGSFVLFAVPSTRFYGTRTVVRSGVAESSRR